MNSPTENKTLLIIYPGKGGGDQVYSLLVAETGEGLCSHWCSSPGFAPGDLIHNRSEREEEYRKRFGEYEVKFWDETDIDLNGLIEKNKEFHKNDKE